MRMKMGSFWKSNWHSMTFLASLCSQMKRISKTMMNYDLRGYVEININLSHNLLDSLRKNLNHGVKRNIARSFGRCKGVNIGTNSNEEVMTQNELEQFRKDDYFNRQLRKLNLIDTISYLQYEKNISAKIVKDMDEEDAEEAWYQQGKVDALETSIKLLKGLA